MSWRPPVPMGYLDSIQAVGGFAAPLLAGGSFTLAVVALQSAPGPAGVSRWPNAALALFVLSGLLQIATIQATAWARRYMCTPGDLREWFPGEETDGTPSPFLIGMQESHLRQAQRWANMARGFYHAGIIALLAGLLVICVPRGQLTGGRWTVLAVCAAGIVGELAWLVRATFLDRAIRRDAWLGMAVLLAIPVSVSAPGIWHGWPVRIGGAACLLLCLLPLVLRRSVTSALSLSLGAIALLIRIPHPLLVVTLVPAFLLGAHTFVDLTRRQRAVSG
ncbi:hypothetical protein [Streptomyces sp. 5-10]|uniref:hypothetical protein n=1 Tax=Streptomyces sp. 5-10 TaxID=878925 RepID=UPI00168BB204|nr:hypothetical protein [Streptomyces sp. 5-10]MBD3010505.1 hypothetical protein [Streptomyces sp. 5-10]